MRPRAQVAGYQRENGDRDRKGAEAGGNRRDPTPAVVRFGLDRSQGIVAHGQHVGVRGCIADCVPHALAFAKRRHIVGRLAQPAAEATLGRRTAILRLQTRKPPAAWSKALAGMEAVPDCCRRSWCLPSRFATCLIACIILFDRTYRNAQAGRFLDTSFLRSDEVKTQIARARVVPPARPYFATCCLASKTRSGVIASKESPFSSAKRPLADLRTISRRDRSRRRLAAIWNT